MKSLADIAFWHWWILALVLFGVEVFAPGASFLWLGIAAVTVGLVILIAPEVTWQVQFILFAVLAVASVIAWRIYLHRHPTRSDQPTLNRRGEQYVGRIFTLNAAMVDGRGTIRVDDTTWTVMGDDLPAGAKIRVTGVEGTVLRIDSE